ncbi:MAG: carbohydrate kinase family protein [Candidatus Hydrothermarchaeales archaeon]
MRELDVIGVGALNYDRLIRVEKIAHEGEEVGVKSISTAPGGSAANTIVGLTRLGMKTGFIGRVGDDEEGEFILRDLEKEGVDISAIVRGEGKTGLILAFIDDKGERAMYAYPGVNDEVRIDDSAVSYAKKARFLHLSSFVGEMSYQTQKQLLEKIADAGVSISFAPGMLYAKKGLAEMEQVIESSYVVFLNKEETKMLTGKEYQKGAGELLRKGAEIVAITLGRDGCYVASKEESIAVESFPAEVVDTTGAGDAFAAGFLYGLLNERTLEGCGRLGNKLASLCITKMGARDGLPRKNEVVL